MATCGFTLDYSDPETGAGISYECRRDCLGDGEYCLFHDKKYHESHPDEVVKQFKKELASGYPESFVGCHLPSFEVSLDKEQACFNSAVFHGRVLFRKAKCVTLDLSDAEFRDDVQIHNLTAKSLMMHNLHFDGMEVHEDLKAGDKDGPKTNKLKLFKCIIEKLDVSTRIILPRLIMEDSDIETCSFFQCEFSNGLSADKCTFSKDVEFKDSTFKGDTKFARCRFKEGLDLDGVVFKGLTSFDHVIFNSPESVTFEGDLSNVSFAGTDISRVDFGVDVIWGGKDGYTIRDETDLHDGKGPGLKLAVSTYRNLRENRELRLMYSAAGKFFVKEMELQRKFKDDGGTTRKRGRFKSRASLRCAYMCLSNYGESPRRLLPYAAVLLFLGMCAFYPKAPCATWDVLECLTLDGVKSAFGGLREALFGTDVTGTYHLLIRLPALFLLGMGFISLRRIYERRFRH